MDHADHESLGGCDEMATVLQPFIDDELDDKERDAIATHLGDCDPCRAEVQRQHAVRAALQQLELAAVPEGLLARIREELDRVDLENAEGVTHIGFAKGAPSRLRAFGRGIGMMLPAAAAAVALFFVVRANPEGETADAAGMLPATSAPANVEAEVDGPAATPPSAATPIARQALPPGIELVSDVADPQTGAYHYADRRHGREFAGFVQPAGANPPGGTQHLFRGETYYLSRDPSGRARVQVRRAGKLYTFVDVGAPAAGSDVGGEVDSESPDFQRLVAFTERLGDGGP